MNMGCKVFPSCGRCIYLTILNSFTKIKYVQRKQASEALNFSALHQLFLRCAEISLTAFPDWLWKCGRCWKTTWKCGRMIKNREQLRDWQCSRKALSVLHKLDLNCYHPRTLSQCQNTKLGIWLIQKAARGQCSLFFLGFCAQQGYKGGVQK